MILSVPSPARSCMPQARRTMRPSRSLQPSRRPVVIRCLQQLGTSLTVGGSRDGDDLVFFGIQQHESLVVLSDPYHPATTTRADDQATVAAVVVLASYHDVV